MRITSALRAWADCLAARFSAPVLLVGSAVTCDDPRDVDIRVILPDDQFEFRYGTSVEEWLHSRPGPLWVRDVAKLNEDGVHRLRVNLDLQIVPASEASEHIGRPRILLAAP